MVKCSTLDELIREARLLFELAEESKVFIQRFDELWMERVDVESLNEVNDRDKLFLVCTEHINSNVEKEVCYSFKNYLPVFFLILLSFIFILFDNPGSQTENESDENLWCFCQKEEYG